MPTVEDVRAYVGAGSNDDPFIEGCISQAQALVTEYVGSTEVPHTVMESVVTQVASELFHRRQAPSGISQFSTMDGSPMRVARDPLTSVYALLNRYVTMGV
jgi:hypothetical protein